jgi:hypothetical protein
VPDYVVNIGAQVDETTTAQIMQMELGSPGMAMVGAMNDALAAGFGSVAVRFIGEPDTVHPVKALLGVLADDDVTDSEIDAFVAGYVTPPAASEEEEAGPQYLFANLPFGRVRFAQRGEGEAAIVLVHGFGGDLDNWLFNIDALAEQATVYAFDLPGHGQSSKGITDPTLRGLSQALFAFIDGWGWEPPTSSAIRSAARSPCRRRSMPRTASNPFPHRFGRARPRDQCRVHRRLYHGGLAPRAQAGARASLRQEGTREPSARRRRPQIQATGRRRRSAEEIIIGTVLRGPAAGTTGGRLA